VSSRLARSKTEPGEVVLHLEIADGWHVNANPASLEFLIPTRVRAVRADTRIGIEYPAGTRYHPRFSPEPLSVYADEVEIAVRSDAPLAGGEKLALTFQACDDSTCLPPETVELAVP